MNRPYGYDGVVYIADTSSTTSWSPFPHWGRLIKSVLTIIAVRILTPHALPQTNSIKNATMP